jgi:hypothetical protein
MDIIIKSVLDFIQTIKGKENSILAGGAVRDHVYGLTPSDYDFCVPSTGKADMIELAGQVATEFKVLPMLKSKTDYHQNDNFQRLTTVWGLELEGKKIDLIGHREENDEDFAQTVIEKFDYGVNMAYFNGNQVVDDYEKFKTDYEFHEMTLWNLDSISNLPNAIKRFEKFQDKLKIPLTFRAPVLELTSKKRKSPDKKLAYAQLYGGTNPAADLIPDPWAPVNTPATPTPWPPTPISTNTLNQLSDTLTQTMQATQIIDINN